MNNPVLDYVREDDIKHDPWGTAMHAAFAVCEALYLTGEDVPYEWDFKPSPLLGAHDIEGYLSTEYGYLGEECFNASTSDLLYAGTVLHHYLNIVRKAGRDY